MSALKAPPLSVEKTTRSAPRYPQQIQQTPLTYAHQPTTGTLVSPTLRPQPLPHPHPQPISTYISQHSRVKANGE